MIIGTHYHLGQPDTLRRQDAASRALRELPGVRLVNLQFADGATPFQMDGVETVARLRRDSRRQTGIPARRTPIMPEMCNVLCEIAAGSGATYFMLVNSDEAVRPAALAVVASLHLEGYIFTRMDLQRDTGEELGLLLGGQGCWVFRVDWWQKNGWRFRPFNLGEPYFDNIVTAKLLCHARARLFNRSGEFVHHEDHPRIWQDSPFMIHSRYLASLDHYYLDRWHQYIARLTHLRALNASEAEEMALQEEIFKYEPSPRERLIQAGRAVKAVLRFQVQRFRMLRHSAAEAGIRPEPSQT